MSLEKFTQKGARKSSPLQKTNADGELALRKRGRPKKEGMVPLHLKIDEVLKKHCLVAAGKLNMSISKFVEMSFAVGREKLEKTE